MSFNNYFTLIQLFKNIFNFTLQLVNQQNCWCNFASAFTGRANFSLFNYFFSNSHGVCGCHRQLFLSSSAECSPDRYACRRSRSHDGSDRGGDRTGTRGPADPAGYSSSGTAPSDQPSSTGVTMRHACSASSPPIESVLRPWRTSSSTRA